MNPHDIHDLVYCYRYTLWGWGTLPYCINAIGYGRRFEMEHKFIILAVRWKVDDCADIAMVCSQRFDVVPYNV